jgi:TetR/AcrR family transcriptional regulator, regulator of cefoperazone and chloramphenicol sensitivity
MASTHSLHPPQSELGAHTRERLLDVAEQMFAEGGYAATSVRDITRVAECNLASVNYHFGGKHNLYFEVLRRRIAGWRKERIASIEGVMGRGSPELERVLRAFADAFLGPFVAPSGGRRLIELWAREMLDPQIPREVFIAELVAPVQAALVEALIAASPGLDRDDARLCVLSLVGQLIHVAHRSRMGDVVATSAAGQERLIEHIVRFTAAGVRGCCNGHRGPRAVKKGREGVGRMGGEE